MIFVWVEVNKILNYMQTRASYKYGLRQLEHFTSKTIEINCGTSYSRFLMAAHHSNKVVGYLFCKKLFLNLLIFLNYLYFNYIILLFQQICLNKQFLKQNGSKFLFTFFLRFLIGLIKFGFTLKYLFLSKGFKRLLLIKSIIQIN